MKTYAGYTPQVGLVKLKSDFPKVKITRAEDSVSFIRKFYHDDIAIYESFFILLLNRANSTIGWAKIGQGGVTGVVVDIRIVAKYAIEALACSVIIAHNHPSGNTSPSDADINVTNKIKNTLSLFDCKLMDHIILTEDSYCSLSEEGIL